MISYLLTNDDGIDADGLKALEQVFHENNLVVAPIRGMSLCSHQVTTDRPLKMESRGPKRYAVDGTPADCVRLAFKTVLKSSEEACWVLSGINSGGNMGVDIYHSGTVAAVREATFHGYSGVAFSQYLKRGHEPDWGWSARQAGRVWERILQRSSGCERESLFWNVNLPPLDRGDSSDPEIVFCGVSRQPLPVDYQETAGGWKYSGVYSERAREKGSDIDHVFSGRIAVTLL